jgi:hypothetical protein
MSTWRIRRRLTPRVCPSEPAASPSLVLNQTVDNGERQA